MRNFDRIATSPQLLQTPVGGRLEFRRGDEIPNVHTNLNIAAWFYQHFGLNAKDKSAFSSLSLDES